MPQAVEKVVCTFGVGLMLAANLYRVFVSNHRPVGSAAATEEWALAASWPTFFAGLGLAAAGAVTATLGATRDAFAGVSAEELARLARKRSRSVAKLTLLLSGALLVVWGPVVLTMDRGDAIRPMAQLGMSALFVAIGICVGLVESLRQALCMRSKLTAFVTLALATVPFLLTVVMLWFLEAVMRVTYKP